MKIMNCPCNVGPIKSPATLKNESAQSALQFCIGKHSLQDNVNH